MSKFKTHQTEHDFNIKRDFSKTTSVRSGQTLPLKQLVASAQRGMLPDSVTFNRMNADGFIPPQYDRSHLSERFNRMKEIVSELRQSPDLKNKSSVDNSQPNNVDSQNLNPAE